MNKEKLLGLSFSSEMVTFKDNGEELKYMVKEMDTKTGEKYDASLYKIVRNEVKYDTEGARSRLILYTLCDLEGKRIFEDKDLGLIETLPNHVTEKIFKVASKLNKIDHGTTEKN